MPFILGESYHSSLRYLNLLFRDQLRDLRCPFLHKYGELQGVLTIRRKQVAFLPYIVFEEWAALTPSLPQLASLKVLRCGEA